MARTRAVMFCSDYNVPEFDALSPLAQWLYTRLLLQPKLTMAGLLVVQPGRWSQLGSGLDVGPLLTELEEAGWIAVDPDTVELVLCHHLRDDVARSSLPANTIKGIWSAWEAIDSPRLRQVVVDNMPGVIWAKSVGIVPSAALEMRRPAPSEPSDMTDGSDAGSDDRSTPPDQAVGPDQPLPLPTPLPTPLPAAGPDRSLSPLALVPAEHRTAAQVGLVSARAHLNSSSTKGEARA